MSAAPHIVEVPTAVSAEQPWPGLAAFEEGDFDFFKGREAAISAMARLVIREDLTFLWGFSGLGKTSLLRAGLFPRLREADIFPVYVRLRYDANDPPLVQQCFDAIEEAAERWGYEIPTRGKSGTLWEYARRRDHRFWNNADRLATPLLVFDQFEEIFSSGRVVPWQDVTAFFADLSSAITGTTADERLGEDDYLFRAGVFKVLISFREDFVAQVAKCAPLVTGIGHHYYRLEALKFDDAVAVVREGGGHLIESVTEPSHEELCRRIVDHVAGTGSAASRAAATVDPALLSLYCRQLNERRYKLKKQTISAGLLEEGKASTIIPDFYEACLGRVSAQSRSVLERHLVLHQSGTRDSIAEETLLDEGLKPDELEQLIGQRILRRDTTRQPRIEFTHDVLVKPAADAFARRELERQRAEAEQQRVERDRRQFLLIGAVALITLAVIAGLASWRAFVLSREQTIRLLIAESQRLLNQDPQRGTQFSIWAAGASLRHGPDLQAEASDALNRSARASATEAPFDAKGLTVTLNAGGTRAAVVHDDRKAVDLLDLKDPSALPQTILAREGLTVSEVKFFADDTELLLLNSDASVERVQLSGPATRTGVMSTASAGFETGLATNRFGGIRELKQWALTDGGRVMVLSFTREYPKLSEPSSPTEKLRYWLSMADRGGDLWTREISTDGVSDVILADDGSRYAVINPAGLISVKEVDGKTVGTRAFPPSAFVVSADGAHVLVAPRSTPGVNSKREVTLWKPGLTGQGGSDSHVTVPGRDEILNTVFSPDGTIFAVLQASGVAQFWRTSSLQPIFAAPLPASSLRFSADSRSVLTWDNDSAAQLWRLDGGDRPVGTRGGQDGIIDVAFAERSDRLAVLTASGLRLSTTSADTRAVDVVIDTGQTGAQVLAFAPDGKAVTVGGINGMVTASVIDGSRRPTTTEGLVTALAYTADSSTIAAAIEARTPTDPPTAVIRITRDGPYSRSTNEVRVSGRVTSMAFVGPSQLAYLVETVDSTGRVEIADVQNETVVRHDCFRRFTGLSADERSGRFAFGVFETSYQSETEQQLTFDVRNAQSADGRAADCNAPPAEAGTAPAPRNESARATAPQLPAPALPERAVDEGFSASLPISAINDDLTAAISSVTQDEVKLWKPLNLVGAAIRLKEPVRAVAISRDGRRFAVGSENGMVKMFNVRQLNDPITLQQSGASIQAIAFSADGRQLAALDANGRAMVFPLSAAELIARARPLTAGLSIESEECRFLGDSCDSDPTSFGALVQRMLGLRRR